MSLDGELSFQDYFIEPDNNSPTSVQTVNLQEIDLRRCTGCRFIKILQQRVPGRTLGIPQTTLQTNQGSSQVSVVSTIDIERVCDGGILFTFPVTGYYLMHFNGGILPGGGF